jgi:hypothetical protein
METILKGALRVYHAMLAITGGPAPTAKNMPQILTTVRRVMERTWQEASWRHHAQVAIIADGLVPMQMPLMKTLLVAKPAMVLQLQRVQIVIIVAGVAPTAKNMPQILRTAKHVTERT